MADYTIDRTEKGPIMDDRERIALLEKQVDVLRRAIGLLTVSGAPTVAWMDATFAGIDPESHDVGAADG